MSTEREAQAQDAREYVEWLVRDLHNYGGMFSDEAMTRLCDLMGIEQPTDERVDELLGNQTKGISQ